MSKFSISQCVNYITLFNSYVTHAPRRKHNFVIVRNTPAKAGMFS
jgi:hypothetical protein